MPAAFRIQSVERITPSEIADCDFSFDILNMIVPPFDKSLESILQTQPQEPYRKQYGGVDKEELDISDEPHNRFLAAVFVQDRIRGYILVSRMWNGVASLDDIAVDDSIRGRGVAKQLLQRALEWVKQKNLPSLRAETQSNNVEACQMYRKFGFKFGGYDEYLYSNVKGCEHETALFWYYFVDEEDRSA